MAERFTRNEQVGNSILPRGCMRETRKRGECALALCCCCGEVAKRSNALGSGPSPSGSRVRFSPSSLFAPLAQLVERGTSNPEAAGSTPAWGSASFLLSLLFICVSSTQVVKAIHRHVCLALEMAWGELRCLEGGTCLPTGRKIETYHRYFL